MRDTCFNIRPEISIFDTEITPLLGLSCLTSMPSPPKGPTWKHPNTHTMGDKSFDDGGPSPRQWASTPTRSPCEIPTVNIPLTPQSREQRCLLVRWSAQPSSGAFARPSNPSQTPKSLCSFWKRTDRVTCKPRLQEPRASWVTIVGSARLVCVHNTPVWPPALSGPCWIGPAARPSTAGTRRRRPRA